MVELCANCAQSKTNFDEKNQQQSIFSLNFGGQHNKCSSLFFHLLVDDDDTFGSFAAMTTETAPEI